MKKYDLITPEGTRDLLFDESVARRTAEETLRKIFTENGYSEVITPELEFFDVFNSKSRSYAPELMYKLTDEKGRLLVLRPDNTLPIARLVATRLQNEVFPQKLFYSQNIFRANPKNSGRDDLIAQSGIEIIGGDTRRSDFESLSLALDVMKSSGVGFRFEIGDSAFYRLLLARLPKALSEDETDELTSLISTKNYPALSAFLSDFTQTAAVRALEALPRLFGGAEVFEMANALFTDNDTRAVLSELKLLYDDLSKLGIADKITVDLAMVSRTDYYTGIVFRGYAEGFGMPILSGGRYDSLIGGFGKDVPATGFAVSINALATAILRNSEKTLLKKPDVLVFAEKSCMTEAVGYAKKLISEGLTVENAVVSDEKTAMEYARAKGIKRLDIVGEESCRIVEVKD